MDVKSTIRSVLPKRVKGFLKGIAWSLVQGDVAASQQAQVRRQLDDYLTRLDFARAITASIERAAYVEEHMQGAEACASRWDVLDRAVKAAKPAGSILEFGVFDGSSINFIAERVPDAIVHGFDAFRGLPEDWMSYVTKGEVAQGEFDLQGRPPPVRSNVQLHVGWFDEVLPTFVAKHADTVSFLHIDCDLYSSTKTVLSALGERIRPGCVIVFDEYVGYPGWQEHEYKALREFLSEYGVDYRYLYYNENEWQVAVLIV
jgi:predicted O-methyltransferase YrrM